MFRSAALLLVWALASAALGNSSEYALKAALLKKVAAFVEWPQSTRGHSVCVLGADPFGSYLEEVFSDAEDLIRRLPRVGPELEGCGMLWLSDSEEAAYRSVLVQLANAPVLTVSDIPHFSSHGGMINLRLVNRRVRFVVNPGASDAAGLSISHKLLRLAEIVETEQLR